MRTLLWLCAGLFFMGFIKDPEEILWQENRPLTWSDFRGKPEPRNSIASTHYRLKRRTADHGNFAAVSITAVFYPNESWKRKKKPGVLEHEQRHFDIVELFARKLRKQLLTGTYRDYDELVEKLNRYFDQVSREMDNYQNKYDRATNYSRNSKRQAKWNLKVATELNELAAYKENRLELIYSKP